MAFLVGGANSAADTGYDIENSLRFNDGDSPFLSFTPASAGNRRTWTFSCWIKLGTLGINRIIFAGGVVASTYLRIFDTDVVGFGVSGDANYRVGPILRDPSAWYHLVYKVDTTAGSNRMIIFVNGETVYSGTPSSWDLNHDGHINQDELHSVGKETDGTSADRFFDGYMAEVFFIDGTAHDASDFGETDSDSGIWKPKDCKDDLTFGTNGFYLEFKQTGTSADSSGKGADTSGEDNHYDDNGMTAEDQCTDTPTNNFATLNPIDKAGSGAITFSEGNLKAAVEDNGNARGNFFVNSGKWYWETLIVSGDSVSTVGIAEPGYYSGNLFDGSSTAKGYIYINDGNKRSPAGSAGAYGDSYADDDIIGVALNMDDGEVTFYKNNATQDVAFSSLSGDHGIYYQGYGGTATVILNTGNPAFSISSGNADANGYGNFEYAPPNGFYALCTKNLAEYG
jgi:hypothetical protein